MDKRRTAGIAVNLLLFVITAACVLSFFLTAAPEGAILNNRGMRAFRFYTTDSNILCAAGGLLTAVCMLRKKNGALPRWVTLVKFAGTAAVTVTLLVVFFFLSLIVGGILPLLRGANLYLHLVVPLLALLSLFFLDPQPEPPLRFSESLSCALTVIVYGTVYFIQVVVRKAWPDFYAFNRGGLWPVTAAVMLVFSVLLGLALRYVMRKCGIRGKKPN